MASKDETLAGMDAEAQKAQEEFNALCEGWDKDTVEGIASWWSNRFRSVGHKRLAYILMGKK